MDLDLRRLRCFVEVAGQLSFVRAAERLHMTQPALSRQIAALESELGVTLFDRSRQGTSLSTDGAALLDRARALLRDAADFERQARVLGRTPVRFVIGFMPGVDAGALIAQFEALHPEVDVAPIFTSTTNQAAFLLDGRADIVFCRTPLAVDGARIIELFDEPVVAAVPRDHPFADAHSVPIDEIIATGDVLYPPAPGGTRDPERETDAQEAVIAVAMGRGIAILPAGVAAFYSDPGVAYVPVPDAPAQTVSLAYLADRAMPQTLAFADLCREALESRVRALPELLSGGRSGS
ncbi:LysR family transcriptional regulator [Leifsonia sp. NPDC077715]|uniref:LysR family transcriptional regulator n=1 Tax=Leifsonia sp. NPDC077715 TaxID=3155539 RepID=UPI00343DBAA4